ncbi:MAG TPA: hypothetical protein VNI57_11665, partial [Candidatus Saccharimonadales bacterium]|nr:hypothetical protein [Candidatus Saccharimonadales bacterium]
MRRSAPFAVLSLLLVIPTVAWCQPQGPKAGPEFQVNTYTTGSQYSDGIGVSADGSFTILWDSLRQDGSDWGIFGRRFDSLGNPLDASDFQVNTYTTGLQIYGSL